jgi:hypothetical protein
MPPPTTPVTAVVEALPALAPPAGPVLGSEGGGGVGE